MIDSTFVIAASSALDIVKIVIKLRLDFWSYEMLRAERKPAIGALMRSSVQPKFLMRQRTPLYITLNNIRKRANFALS